MTNVAHPQTQTHTQTRTSKRLILRKSKIERSVLDLALERINHAFDLFDTVDVRFSGGKDSTVCLMLALQVAHERGRLPLRVIHHDEEAIPLETEEYVRRVSQLPGVALEWYCLPVKHRNACSHKSPWWSPWDPDQRELWVRPLPAEGITELEGFPTGGEPRDRLSIPHTDGLLCHPRKYGRVGMIMGIRAQESLTRYRAVAHRRTENYINRWTEGPQNYGNISKVYPIYDWQVEDVWTAPLLYGWDYNRAYDVMEAAGIPPSQQRCSPAYGEEPLKGFALYKECFPEIWDRMSQRVPGANTAMLYSRTELYGFGGQATKREDETWEQCLLRSVAQFATEEQHIVAGQLTRAIAEHYHKTSDPIVERVPHPQTGVSWSALYAIAVRGDFKNRRASTLLHNAIVSKSQDPREIEKAWQKYRTARSEEGV